ncbi:ABC transporter ATP-binding protein [Verrucomicrobiales bacterium]|jgi:ABC-type lipoprotein export system ATPase subunit|nr:ABC transporter ATP-binding protein [Verrucomicrobiales bacterium]MDF1785299.1 ABC transporter ATP-binding protein [Verrucomicrobiales bacterium]
MATPIIQAESLTKAFGSNEVLRSVDLELATGERVALIGPSGSGKSTLLNCLGGLERVDGGSLIFDGLEMQEMGGDALAALRRERLSSIFQFFHLLPTLTAEENVAFPLRLLDLSSEERYQRVGDLMDKVQLTPRKHALPEQLSGGEQQRVAIARALAIRPKLILADEPTGNLDSVTGAAILDLIESLTEAYQTALVLVTHSLEATRICHRTLRMRDGVILEEGV